MNPWLTGVLAAALSYFAQGPSPALAPHESASCESPSYNVACQEAAACGLGSSGLGSGGLGSSGLGSSGLGSSGLGSSGLGSGGVASGAPGALPTGPLVSEELALRGGASVETQYCSLAVLAAFEPGLARPAPEERERPQGNAPVLQPLAALAGAEIPAPTSFEKVDVLHPLAVLSNAEISDRVTSDLASLGSMSVGLPQHGALVNGVRLQESPHIRLTDPKHAWGTTETVRFIEHAVARVVEQYPAAPELYVGDLSGERGGHLWPHRSHQSGRDVDIGYYYKKRAAWYRRATSRNLDTATTWALVRVLLRETPVKYIFMDRRVQRLLRREALAQGEDRAWVDRVFQVGGRRPYAAPVRHRWGHATHLHVRFENPTAELTARRAYSALRSAKVIPRKRFYRRPSTLRVASR